MQFSAIWHIFFGSEWPRMSFKIEPLQNKKTVAATILKSPILDNKRFVVQTCGITQTHKHPHTPPHFPKTPRISATIKSKLNFRNIFSDIVYNVKNKIDFAKNRGPGPLDPPLRCEFVLKQMFKTCFLLF